MQQHFKNIFYSLIFIVYKFLNQLILKKIMNKFVSHLCACHFDN